jgi:hypothetical protein
MLPQQLGKLYAATNSIAEQLAQPMHENARFCTDMCGETKLCETKPPQDTQARSLNPDRGAVSPQRGHDSQTLPASARKCTELPSANPEYGKTNPRPLAPRQLRAVELLLSGRTIKATAGELGVNECTIRRWKSDPRFHHEVRQRAGAIRRTVRPAA